MTVKRYERLDFTADSLKKPETTPEGFWRVWGRLARTGVQEYRRADGSACKELRTPSDVRASLPGFSLAPLTNQHPPSMLTPDNAKQYVAGAVGDAKFDGKWVTAPITVYDAELIESIKAGRVQVSAGYSCELMDESGEYEGAHYDCRQTAIKINHVAIVNTARAGEEARIRLDGTDAATGEFLPTENHMIGSELQREDNRMHTFRLDGIEVQVADANQQTLIERAIKNAQEAARKDESDKAAKSATEIQAKLDVESAKLKALQEKHDALSADIPAKAKALAELMDNARKHLGENFKADGGEVSWKRDIIKRVLPKLDGVDKADGARLDSLYDAALAVAAEKPTEMDMTRATTNMDSNRPDPEAARKRMLERNQSAFVK